MRWHRRLLAWYAKNGRAALPWRVVRDPYYTLVSEFMLQQTQVDRVVPKFEAFVRRFPDVASLARASAADVLRAWKGLGYNSRAVRLKRVAEAAVERHAGAIPRDTAALRQLPGIGAYTAAAIRAFAFDLPDVPEDTNLRRIATRLGEPLEPPRGKAHDWASALMDLGASICTARAPKCQVCPLGGDCRSAGSSDLTAPPERKALNGRAVPFEKTTRYARGRIVDRLRELPPGRRISLVELRREMKAVMPDRSARDVNELVDALERDGLVSRTGDAIALAGE